MQFIGQIQVTYMGAISIFSFGYLQTCKVLVKAKKNVTFFFLNDLFLYLAIDTVFHPSGIIQNGMEISSKSHV